MKNSLQSLVGVSALAFLFVAMPVMAAVDTTGENVDTGPNSENENEFEISNTPDTNVTNQGHINEQANVDADTGFNDQNGNTSAGDQESGGVDASTEWDNVLNSGMALVAGDGEFDISSDFTNDTTGPNSENENELEVRNDIDTTLRNLARVLNSLRLDADTGFNDQNGNTNAGSQTTGGVEGMFGISNMANNDSGLIGYSGLVISADAINDTTGPFSENENETEVRNDVTTNVTNRANLRTRVRVDADTGHNDQNGNTNAGSQSTGDVAVTTDIVNSANNGSGLADAGSGLEVTSDFTNDTTGPNSDNENELEVRNDVDTTVRNNADVNNNVNVDADTGFNDQNGNTNAGSQSTGAVSVNLNSTTEVNNSN
ncbi:MAG: hypothetical protein Q8P73_03805 [bacterium]|nr:hypothetical protein [bacterium]